MTNTFSLIESDREMQVSSWFAIAMYVTAKMLLLPSVYSSPEHYKIKTPFERKVTEQGFLGLVHFSMEQLILSEYTVLSWVSWLKLKDRELDITGYRLVINLWMKRKQQTEGT